MDGSMQTLLLVLGRTSGVNARNRAVALVGAVLMVLVALPALTCGNGYVYVANELSNNVSVINRTTVVGTVAVGNQPEGVGYDNRSGYIYVANFGSNNVSVINGTTVVATIPVGIYPIGVAYDSGNG